MSLANHAPVSALGAFGKQASLQQLMTQFSELLRSLNSNYQSAGPVSGVDLRDMPTQPGSIAGVSLRNMPARLGPVAGTDLRKMNTSAGSVAGVDFRNLHFGGNGTISGTDFRTIKTMPSSPTGMG